MERSPGRWTDDAIVLRKFEYGDSSLILHLLTRQHGCIPMLAKGAHRAKNPLWGTLDVPARLRIEWKPSSTREVQLLLHGELLDSYTGLRKDLHRYFLVLYAIELVEEAALPSGSSDLYDLTRRFLESLNERRCDPATLAIVFELELLRSIGIQPSFEDCASCGARRKAAPRFAFIPAAGGLVCSACRRPGMKEETIPEGALRVASSLGGTPWEQIPRIRVPAETLRQIRRALDAFLSYHWERMPKTRTQINLLFAAPS